MKKVRLPEKDIQSIIETAIDIFGNDVKIYLFGSRALNDKKGGDIDLYIEMKHWKNVKEMIDRKVRFKIKLMDKIGEQKIDIVMPTEKDTNISKEAKNSGVLIYG